jgi:vacuolar-type H+-ATPase subunit H
MKRKLDIFNLTGNKGFRMLYTLRQIDWPEGLQVSGGIIRGSLLGFVSTYDDLLNQANRKATGILNDARDRAEAEAEELRHEVAREAKSDLKKLAQIFASERELILRRSGELCAQVTKIAIQKYFGNLADHDRMEMMLGVLIDSLHGNLNLVFLVNPAQVDLVRDVLANKFSNLIQAAQTQVLADSTLPVDQLKVQRAEGAYLDISIRNIIAMFSEEVDSLREGFREAIQESVEAPCNLTTTEV